MSKETPRKIPGGALDSTLIEPLSIAKNVAARLGEIEGVAAVALGGSRARGTAGVSQRLRRPGSLGQWWGVAANSGSQGGLDLS